MRPNHQLRHEREQRGWSQQKVARAVGTTPRTISRWELGLSRPYPYFREQLCALFQKNATELGLLDDEEASKEASPASHSSTDVESSLVNDNVGIEPAPALSELDFPDIYDPAIPPPLGEYSDLVGREELLKRVKQHLQVGEQVAITALNGLPGVGKTALAIALATDPEIKKRFRDGILWAGLGPEVDIQGLLQHWGLLLGLPPQDMSGLQGKRAWAIALRRAIGQRRMLLVIDDAWKVEDALALQVGGPLCSYVITTRLTSLAAQIGGSRVVVVPELNEEEGIALLKRFIPDIVNRELETARELVNIVGGLPLAQVLIGRYLHAQAISKQPRRLQRAVEQLRNSEQRLRIALPTSPLARPANLAQEAPWSLQATIAVSDQQLDAQARRALRALAVFPAKPNSFSEEAALAVSQAPVEVLDSLSDSGLLESRGSDYYTLHQTIADYARTQLNDHSAYERFVDYYKGYVEANKEDIKALARENVNIMAALDVAYNLNLHEKYAQLFNAFVHFALRLKDITTYEKYVQRAYEMAQTSEDMNSMMHVLFHLANTQDKRGDFKKAEENAQRLLKLAQSQEDHPMRGMAHTMVSRIALSRCDYKLAEEQANLALTIGTRRQDKLVTYLAYTALGWVAGNQGRYQDLERYAHEMLKRAKQDNSHEFLCFGYLFLGQKALAEGDYIEAQECAQESLDCANAINYNEFACQALDLLIQSERMQGHYQQALEHVEQGLETAQSNGIVRMIGTMHLARGEVLLAQKRSEEAALALREAQRIIPENIVRLQALALYGLAQVEAERGDRQAAHEYGEASLQMLTAIGHCAKESVSEFMVQTLGYNGSKKHPVHNQSFD